MAFISNSLPSHTFCKKCISKALETASKCPVDRTPIPSVDDLSPAPLLILNLLNDLVVYCPHKPRGCDHQCARWLVDRHTLHDCLYTEFECGGMKTDGSICSDPIEKRFILTSRQPENLISNTTNDAESNQQGQPPCFHEPMECPNSCGETFPTFTLEVHVQSACSNVQDQCPVCSTAMPRCDLPHHLNVCPDMVVPCSASEFGCSWIGKRQVLANEHARTCRFTTFAPALTKQNTRIAKLERENKALCQKLDRLLVLEAVSSSSNPRNTNTTVPESNSTSPPRTSTTNFTDSDFMLLFMEGDRFREEIDRVTAALADMEMRHGMSLMQESFRTGEEISNLRGLVNSLRHQMHFLLTERRSWAASAVNMQQQQQQQQQQLTTTPFFSTSPPAPLNNSSDSEQSMTPYSRFQGPRRLSDISRQDVKL